MSMKSKLLKKMSAWALVGVLAVTNVLPSQVTTADAASKKVVKSMKLAKTKQTLTVGQSKKIKVTIKGTGSKKFTVKSSKKAVATAKVAGKNVKITAKKAGKATITVTSKGKNKKGKKLTKKIKVTVNAQNTQNTQTVQKALTLSKTALNLQTGESAKLTATVKPSATVVWTSSNAKVATVNAAGLVSAKAKGTAVVTAAANGLTAKCTVTVVAKTSKVVNISAINPETGEVSLTFETAANAGDLAGTSITLKCGNVTVTAPYFEVSADGKTATYVIPSSSLAKIVTGNYTVTSGANSLVISADVGKTSAKVQIKGSAVKGLVYYESGYTVKRVEGATITIDGSSCTSDADGFYQKSVNPVKDSTLSAKAKGFFDETVDGIDVVSNKASAYNIEMEVYDFNKVYLYGSVTDSKDSTEAVEGAKVVLLEDDAVKAVVYTDENGRYVFANSDADVMNFDIQSDDDGIGLFRIKNRIENMNPALHEYKLVVSKDLSASNLTDVYKSVSTAAIDFGSARGVKKDFAMVKVQAMEEITLSLDWEEKAELKKESTEVRVQLMATDGLTELCIGNIILKDKEKGINYLNDTDNGMKEAYKLADNNYFGTGKNVHPTLPAGTYYLVVKDLDAGGAQQNATTVIPVSLKEGGSFEATATVKQGLSRTINCSVSYTDTYKDITIEAQKAPGTLKAVLDNEGAISSENITTAINVFQVVGDDKNVDDKNVDDKNVDDKNVLIDTISNITLTDEGTTKAYIASKEQKYLASSTSYVVEPVKTVKTHLVLEAGANTETTTSTDNWDVKFKAGAKIVNVKAKELACFRDEYATDGTAAGNENVYVNAVKFKNATKTITHFVNDTYTLNQIVNDGIGVSSADLCGITPGKYTVELDIENYVASTGTYDVDVEEDVIDLQTATLTCDGKYDKVYPTTIKGKITVEKGTNSKGIAVLYSSDHQKILAADYYEVEEGEGSYSLENGIDGTFGAGTYTVLLRGTNMDLQTKEVTIDKANTVVSNQDFTDVKVGGNSNIASPITTNTNVPLDASAEVYIYDQYYINPSSSNVDEFARRALYDSGFDGAYELDRESEAAETWKINYIPAGAYNMEVYTNITELGQFKIDVSGIHDEEKTVKLITYDNLVRIKLYLTNRNDSYEDYQLDYIVAESEDGSVRYDNVFKRTSKVEDYKDFYVPKNKAYVIRAYSNDSIVGETSIASQSKEDEKVYVDCNAIE